jgi:hypothetical protein
MRVELGMVTETGLFEYSYPTPLDFCLWGWMNSEVYGRMVDTPGELLARTLDAAGYIEKHEDQLRRTTLDIRTRVAKCTEVGWRWVFRTFSENRDKFVTSM